MRRILPFAAATLLAMSVAVSAQETPAPDTNDAAQTPTSAAAPAAAPKEEIIAVHKDWQVRCRNGGTNCFMYQLAVDARSEPVAEISIVPIKQQDGAVAGVTVVTPLRSFLPKGIDVQVDTGKVVKFPFLWCAKVGCFVQFGLNQPSLDAYKRGAKARITIFANENRDTPVILDVSLSGFTAAFEEVQNAE